MFGCVKRRPAWPAMRATKRHGSRCEDMKRRSVLMKRTRKTAVESGSLEKLVQGVTCESMASCRVEKSSMLFWRSRMLRKKSLDISEAGLMVRGGARGGPPREYCDAGLGEGGGGCRVR